MNTQIRTNKSTVNNMAKGSIYGQMLGFSLPILLSQIFQQLYNTADSLIVGHFLGTESLAAVSSSGTLIFMMISFFVGTSLGAGIVISRYFGANDLDKLSKAIHTNLVISVLAGLILTAVGVAFTPVFLTWMKTDPDVFPEAVEYFRYYFMGSLSLILYNACRGILNAIGDSRRPLYYLIFSSVLNIFLDLLFVAGFGWGVWSAALATVISQTGSVVLCFIHLLQKDQVYTVKWSKLRCDPRMLKEILKFGFPSGVQNSVIGFANVLVQTSINSFGKFATAAYGAYSKVEGFAFLPINSFTMAISTFISQNLGALEYGRARKGARFGILCGVISTELIGVLVFIFSPVLISFFDSNAMVIALGTQQARTASLFYCLLALSHCIASVCRGSGKPVVPMVIMLSVWCVFRIIYIETVMHFFHDIGLVYWAYPITWGISSVIYILYYYLSDWIHGFDAKGRKT